MQVLGWVTLGVSAGRRQGLWRLWQTRGFGPYLRQAAIWCHYRPNPVWPKPPITLEKPKPGSLYEIAQIFNMNDLSSHSQTKSGLAHRPLVCGHGSHSRLLEARACLPASLLESSHASPAPPHPLSGILLLLPKTFCLRLKSSPCWGWCFWKQKLEGDFSFLFHLRPSPRQ